MVDYSGGADLLPDGGGDSIPILAKLWQRQLNGRTSWGGSIGSPTHDMLILNGGSFTIRLPDGNEGALLIQNIRLHSQRGQGTRQSIEVLGSGDAPF